MNRYVAIWSTLLIKESSGVSFCESGRWRDENRHTSCSCGREGSRATLSSHLLKRSGSHLTTVVSWTLHVVEDTIDHMRGVWQHVCPNAEKILALLLLDRERVLV